SLSGPLAIDPKTISDARNLFSYSTAYEAATMAMASATTQVGKTLHLVGPLDFGWVFGTASRFAWRFPNAAIDETLSLRLRATPDLSLALFGGVTEALAFIDQNVWSRTMQAEDFKGDTHVDAAPHVEGAAWGRIPALGGTEFLLEGGHQFNPYTGVSHARAA